MQLGHSEFNRGAKGASDLLPKKATQTAVPKTSAGRTRGKNNTVLDGQEPRLPPGWGAALCDPTLNSANRRD